MTDNFVLLCAVPLFVLAGCTDAPRQLSESQPTASQQPPSVWADSSDGMLSLRLGAPDTTVEYEDPITVVVELRNNSGETMTVFRPFGDLNAVSSWFAVTGPAVPARQLPTDGATDGATDGGGANARWSKAV